MGAIVTYKIDVPQIIQENNLSKFYYWRRGRAHNADTLHFMFCRREDANGVSACIKPTDDNMWFFSVVKPFSRAEGVKQTQEEAQKKVESLILSEFRPEYIPYFG